MARHQITFDPVRVFLEAASCIADDAEGKPITGLHWWQTKKAKEASANSLFLFSLGGKKKNNYHPFLFEVSNSHAIPHFTDGLRPSKIFQRINIKTLTN